jgi:hypothetical protein
VRGIEVGVASRSYLRELVDEQAIES